MTRAQRLLESAIKIGVNERQRKFVEEYVANGGNKLQAAISAGYAPKSADVKAAENFKKPKVMEYLSAVFAAVEGRTTERRIMDGDEVLGRLTEHASVDVADFITVSPTPPPVLSENAPHQPSEAPVGPSWAIDIPKAIENGKSHLIKEISYDANGLPKLKLVDSQAALDKLAKYHGHYKDDGGASQTTNVTLIQVLQQDPQLARQMAMALLRGVKA